MKKIHGIFTVCTLLFIIVIGAWSQRDIPPQTNGAPPYGEALEDVPTPDGRWSWLGSWERPDGPARVGLQVGHWKNDELPEELDQLIGNTGASGGGKWEWEVNLAIAEKTAAFLREKGVTVDILPATVPPDYWADAFVAIHADGSTSKSANGFKVSGPWRDYTNNAAQLVSYIESSYKAETDMYMDPNISRNMRGYYAFAWWRYEHSVHPMTTSAIFEAGFLTNASDRKLLIGNPEKAAKGLGQGIVEYLESKDLPLSEEKT